MVQYALIVLKRKRLNNRCYMKEKESKEKLSLSEIDIQKRFDIILRRKWKLEYRFFLKLEDLCRLYSVDVELNDYSKPAIALYRELAKFFGVAPVCLVREKPRFRVYGEKPQVWAFISVINKLANYREHNYATDLAKKNPNLASHDKLCRVSSQTVYVNGRKGLLELIKYHRMLSPQKGMAEYLFHLYGFVAEKENLIS